MNDKHHENYFLRSILSGFRSKHLLYPMPHITLPPEIYLQHPVRLFPMTHFWKTIFLGLFLFPIFFFFCFYVSHLKIIFTKLKVLTMSLLTDGACCHGDMSSVRCDTRLLCRHYMYSHQQLCIECCLVSCKVSHSYKCNWYYFK
jgi:hypothetical protein